MGATTIAPGSAATMMGSSLGRGGRVGSLTVARSNLSGIISRMILPTDEFGFGRVVTRWRAGGGVVEEKEGGNFVAPFGRGPGLDLRDSGDAGHDPRGGINKTSASSQKLKDRGRGENEITCQDARCPALIQVSEDRTPGLNVENVGGLGEVC